jgi:hypothetical protein
MRSRSEIRLSLAVLSILFATISPKTAAQCTAGLLGLGEVTTMGGSPFQAEIKRSWYKENSPVQRIRETQTIGIARDGEGRLRIDWNEGKVKVQSGPGAGTEEEQHRIKICDPVKGVRISLDTLSKTATVFKENFALPPPEVAGNFPSVCSRKLRNLSAYPEGRLVDLGHRSIEGLDAEGVLQKWPPPTSSSEGSTVSVKEPTFETEVWCSAELGAVILWIMRAGEKENRQSAAMSNVQRGEPQPTLFQIPPDYRIVEKVDGEQTPAPTKP